MEKREEDLFDDTNCFDEDLCFEDNGNNYSEQDKQMYDFIDNLQQIVIEDEFSEIRNTFFEKYSEVFDKDSDENSLESYEIFKKYTKEIEGFLTDKLNQRIKNLNLDQVMSYLISKKDEELIDEELLEMLISFTDFCVFKEMMLDYKKNKNFSLKIELSKFN